VDCGGGGAAAAAAFLYYKGKCVLPLKKPKGEGE
jgi:hypothetical protein